MPSDQDLLYHIALRWSKSSEEPQDIGQCRLSFWQEAAELLHLFRQLLEFADKSWVVRRPVLMSARMCVTTVRASRRYYSVHLLFERCRDTCRSGTSKYSGKARPHACNEAQSPYEVIPPLTITGQPNSDECNLSE